MLLQEPPESPYDLRFEMFGFPIRIAWTFWIGAAVFGNALASGLHDFFRQESPGRLPLLLLWAVLLLVSVLIHELGHAFAFRRYGIESKVLLYHFGGLAIPRSSYSSGQFNFAPVTRLSPIQDLIIAAAGPFAQIFSALILVLILKAAGYGVTALEWLPLGFDRVPWVQDGRRIESVGLYALTLFYLFPSILWALLNLLPVWPLDGGRIARAILQIFGGDVQLSL
ncbi:MAG: site-2 protease family protein, partial [Planctomycetota bacterium]